MARVSVVIPVFNSERYVADCLERVISQTLSDIEVICVDDGSTDGSRAILDEYAKRDSRITVLRQLNGGVSKARNAGLDRASGEYVLFLDSDDYLEIGALEKVCERCDRDEADLGIFKIRYIYADRNVSTEADWSLRMDLIPDTTPFSCRDMVGSIFRFVTPAVWNKLLRRSFLLDEGVRFAPDLKRAEDVAFTYTALLMAKRITVIDEALINYRAELPTGLQSTIHEKPLEICNALLLTKEAATAAGVFEEFELDFVNAALHQCLFTLRSLKTVAAFKELYDALKYRYFSELGIDGISSDRFHSLTDLQHFTSIMAMPADAYLLSEARALHGLTASLNVGNSMREELRATRATLSTTTAELKVCKAELNQVRKSRSYRVARGFTGSVRRIARYFSRSRKAE